VHLNRVLGAARRAVAPQVGDERRRRDDAAGPEQEQAEQRTLARCADIQLGAVGVDGERTEQAKAERCDGDGQWSERTTPSGGF